MHGQVRVEFAGRLLKQAIQGREEASSPAALLDPQKAEIRFRRMGNLAQSPARPRDQEGVSGEFRRGSRKRVGFGNRKVRLGVYLPADIDRDIARCALTGLDLGESLPGLAD